VAVCNCAWLALTSRYSQEEVQALFDSKNIAPMTAIFDECIARASAHPAPGSNL